MKPAPVLAATLALPLLFGCGDASPASELESLAEDALDALIEQSEEDFVELSMAGDVEGVVEFFTDLESEAKDDFDYLPKSAEDQLERMADEDTYDDLQDEIEEAFEGATDRLENKEDEGGLNLELEEIEFVAIDNVSTSNSFGFKSMSCDAFFTHDEDYYSFRVDAVFVDGSLVLANCRRFEEVD